MTLTIRVRLPRRTQAPSPRELLGIALPIMEPAALLLAEAAGAGLVGRIACASALRAANQALAFEQASGANTAQAQAPSSLCSHRLA